MFQCVRQFLKELWEWAERTMGVVQETQWWLLDPLKEAHEQAQPPPLQLEQVLALLEF